MDEAMTPRSLRRSRREALLEEMEDLDTEAQSLISSSPAGKKFKLEIHARSTSMISHYAAPDSANQNPNQSPSPPPPNQKQTRDKETDQRAPTTRKASDTISLDEYMAYVMQDGAVKKQKGKKKNASKEEKEDAALGRLIRGYGHSGCHGDWKDAFKASFKSITDECITQRVAALQQPDVTAAERLAGIQQALQNEKASDVSHKLADHMARALATATFAIEWANLTGPGSRKQKREFYDRVYQTLPENKAFFANLDPEQRSVAMEKPPHKEAYAAWRSTLEPQITTRNRFVVIYRKVRLFNRSAIAVFDWAQMQFGPSVFLDPFWDLSNAAANEAHTRAFAAMLKKLEEDEDAPGYTVAEERWQGSHDAVAGVTRAIGADLRAAMKAFLLANPDDVALRIRANEEAELE
ncbi:hypothetical protein K438DRAFT_1984205 [Mycena galopus ATCC 62051]|nr:hypothetical protein K438DRAFT_1984205 [Mycena galopus ATCC 62051]